MKRLLIQVSGCATLLISSISIAASAPVPTEIQEKGASITVSGEVASTQEKTALLWPIKLDQHKKPIAFWASSTDSKKAVLGAETAVAAGTYVVWYYGYEIVTLAPGEHKAIQLGKLSVPKIDGTYKIKTFLDMTAPKEQEAFALASWILANEQSYGYDTYSRHGRLINSWSESSSMKDDCAASNIAGTDFSKECQAVKHGTPLDYLHAMMKVRSNGSYAALAVGWDRPAGGPPSLESETWNDPVFYFLPYETADDAFTFADGQFIGVMPGTYGIEVTNLSGKATTRNGISVQ